MNKFVATEESAETWKSREYKVHGYWMRGYLKIYKGASFGRPTIEISWASGGRSTKEEPYDLVAAECFAAALLDAIETARKWREEK